VAVSSLGRLPCGRQSNAHHIPKALLEIQGERFTVEFKSIDNSQKPGDILDGNTNGDTTPEGRFRYRYEL
jgi:hypothetical protein